jgi:channel protein (hemolysin III family)
LKVWQGDLVLLEVIVATLDVDSLPGFREPFNCFSHQVAALVFTGLTAKLLRRGQGNSGRVLALFVFGFTSVFLLMMSGIYHMQWPGDGRDVMEQMDVAAIFGLIAGTFPPAYTILYRGPTRVWLLILIWGVAVLGITFRTIYFASMSGWLGTGLFLGFGWIGAFSAWDLWKRYSFAFIQPLVWGGLAYSCGAIFLEFHWPTLIPRILGPHELWHLAVLIGLGCHWCFVWQFADGDSHTGRTILNQ